MMDKIRLLQEQHAPSSPTGIDGAWTQSVYLSSRTLCQTERVRRITRLVM